MRARANIRAGLTLAEVAISLVVLAVALTAGVQALGSFAVGARVWQDRSVAMELAHRLICEVSALPYRDPNGGSVQIGRETGEVTGSRTTYDDVDDYDGWDASPPQDAAGTAMTQYAGYRQQVSVAYDTSLSTYTGQAFGNSTFKQITVIISGNGRALARLVTIRTDAEPLPAILDAAGGGPGSTGGTESSSKSGTSSSSSKSEGI